MWNNLIPNLLRYDDNPTVKVSTADRIRDYYFGFSSPSDLREFQNLTDMFTDRMHFLPTHRAAKLQSVHSPVFLYYFDYKTVVSILKLVESVNRDLSIIPSEVQIAGNLVKGWINENLFGFKRPFYGMISII